MRKIICIFVLLNGFAQALFAYDFRQVVFGNHYEQIKEVKGESEIERLRGELEPLIEYYNSENGYYTIHGGLDPLNLEFLKIYKEPYENGTVYRMLRYDYDGGFRRWAKDEYSSDQGCYLDGLYQFVFVKSGKATKCLGAYPVYEYYGDGGMDANIERHIYENFSVIAKDKNIRALLLTKTINCEVDFFMEDKREITKKSEGFWFYYDDAFMTRFPKSMDFERESQAIRIEASFPLIDKERPFVYTLQNAFDGDERTAFVEDTEDNLLEVKITQPNKEPEPLPCKTLRIINGYASSERLYRSNNRIREIESENGDSFSCKDDSLSYQESEWSSSQVIVKSLYKGEKYSDTCLAEIDFLIKFSGRREHWFCEN
jgi:hypothetical protein